MFSSEDLMDPCAATKMWLFCMSFQTCMICILLQNIKDDILKNVSSHTVSVTKIVSSTEEKVIGYQKIHFW